MSVSLVWQPIKSTSLHANGQSSTKETLERAFGSFPLELGSESIERLNGLCAGDPTNPTYNELIIAIERHKRIAVRAEY